jgi:hypothetical protein
LARKYPTPVNCPVSSSTALWLWNFESLAPIPPAQCPACDHVGGQHAGLRCSGADDLSLPRARDEIRLFQCQSVLSVLVGSDSSGHHHEQTFQSYGTRKFHGPFENFARQCLQDLVRAETSDTFRRSGNKPIAKCTLPLPP